jgi:Fe-S-cluster containining protein
MVSVENNINMSTSSCQRCGRCCTNFGVCVMPSDVARISRALNLDPADFISTIPEPPQRERKEPAIIIDGKPSLMILKWAIGRVCFFYQENKGCGIYDIRPKLCRTYPFNLSKACLEDMKSRACPNLWFPDENGRSSYIKDSEKYQTGLSRFIKLAQIWNSGGGGSLAGFLKFSDEFLTGHTSE